MKKLKYILISIIFIFVSVRSLNGWQYQDEFHSFELGTKIYYNGNLIYKASYKKIILDAYDPHEPFPESFWNTYIAYSNKKVYFKFNPIGNLNIFQSDHSFLDNSLSLNLLDVESNNLYLYKFKPVEIKYTFSTHQHAYRNWNKQLDAPLGIPKLSSPLYFNFTIGTSLEKSEFRNNKFKYNFQPSIKFGINGIYDELFRMEGDIYLFNLSDYKAKASISFADDIFTLIKIEYQHFKIKGFENNYINGQIMLPLVKIIRILEK